MELKPGYKQTEIGVIPEDWDCTTISSFASVKTGGKNTQDRVEDGAYPFFVRSQEVEKINSYSFDGEAVLTAGDGVGTGKVFHYINGKFDTHQRVYRISNFSSKVDGYFFYFMFSSRFYERIMSMTAKSSVDSVRRNMIVEMQIPIPTSVKEQEAIAAALSSVDALIDSLEALLTKKRNIKTGVMQELLTGRTRLPGFTGQVQEVSLKSFLTINKGNLITEKTALEGNIPVIAGGKTAAYFHNVPNRLKSTVTISGSGANAGYVAFHDYPIYASDCCTIEEKESFHLKYIYFALLLKQNEIYRSQTGGAQPHIHPRNLYPLIIRLPKLREQEAIANVISDIDHEIEAIEKRLAKTRDLKQGMAQELLTGGMRLV